MSKKVKIIISISLVVLIVAGALTAYFLTRDYVGTTGDAPYFGMTETMLKLQKGRPKEVYERDEAMLHELVYTEDVYGFEAEISYSFSTAGVFSDLFDVEVYIGDIDYGSARIIFNKIVNRQIDYRSDHQGYNYTDSSDESNEYLKAEIDTFYGATGISFEIEYDNNCLTMRSDYLR